MNNLFLRTIHFSKNICLVGLIIYLLLGTVAHAQHNLATVGKNAVSTTAVASKISQQALRNQVLSVLQKPLIDMAHLPSSRLLRERYLLISTNIENLRTQYAQTGLETLLSEEEVAERLANLEPLNQEAAPLLATLTSQQKQLLALWEQALLKERNPNFLPRKVSADVLLFDVSPVRKMSELTVSPRFFREWAALIDLAVFSEISEVSAGLLGALGKDLVKLEKDAGALTTLYLKAKEEAQNSALDASAIAIAKKKMDIALGALRKVSHQAAQDVLDMVHILNLYPSVSEDSLKLLAGRLDDLPEKNNFVTMLRAKIKIKEVGSLHRRIGFTK